MASLSPVLLDDIQEARRRIASIALRSPLVRMLEVGASAEIYLKLENLQPGGSFKLRGALNVLGCLRDRNGLSQSGVWTASAGNMGSALAWAAQHIGLACAVIVPHDASQVKLSSIILQGALVYPVPFHIYQEIQIRHEWRGLADLPEDGPLGGVFVHPFADPLVMAGNGTIGLEILEQIPEADAVYVPYGGGGLSCGIAAALKAVKPDVKVYACEVETAAPLAASWAADGPVQVPYTASFVTGMGAPYVFPEMWPLARQLLNGVKVASLTEVRRAIRDMAILQHMISEGAGAAALAAARSEPSTRGKIVCVVSGGNIEQQVLIDILQEVET